MLVFRVVACACLLVATTSRLHAQQPASGDSLAVGTMLRGARNGAIVFGIIGALGNWAFGPYMEPPINLITTGAAVAGAVGAGVGGLMGAAIGSRVWEPIAYPAPPPMP